MTSTENSRNKSVYMSTLKKMSNDSLLLNKGTQTEGDAGRAWEAILQNPNNAALVNERLLQIEDFNRQASEEKKLLVTQLRKDQGVGDIDFAPYENRESNLSASKTPQAPKFVVSQANLQRAANERHGGDINAAISAIQSQGGAVSGQ